MASAPEGLQLLLAVAVIPYASILVAYRGRPLFVASPHTATSRTACTSRHGRSARWSLLADSSVTTLIVITPSLPVTYALAAISRKLVEATALRLRSATPALLVSHVWRFRRSRLEGGEGPGGRQRLRLTRACSRAGYRQP